MNLPATIQQSDPMALSAAVAKSGIAGAKTPEAAFTLACMALAEDKDASANPMAFMAALGRASTSYHLINGRPTMKAETMLARFQQAGGKVQWDEYTDKRVSGTFSHASGGTLTLDWTIDRAKAAGLVKAGSPWVAHPRAMLRSRVIVEAIRTIYPAVLNGTMEQDEAREAAAPTISAAPEPSARDLKAEASGTYAKLAAVDKPTADRLLAESNKNPGRFLELVEEHKNSTTTAQDATTDDAEPVVIEDATNV